ncbi:RNA methyltransferase [Reichenbachiella sp. MALMAid0571]|uniref:TrmH family RNA methyltransferase n=1 Tax=Reichenbachiella sp. MALMAid0571 TaxID=3143939 RepID=UPI0032DFF982
MITNKDAKFIKSLQLKKYRIREKAFVVEGEKNVQELLNSKLKINNLLITEDFLSRNQELINKCQRPFELVTEKDLVKTGSFQSNAFALAVVSTPILPALHLNYGHFLAFDNIQNPGNLGTIIRIADWYGFSSILCSKDSVDAYNPKVISASMGSFTRINVYYENLHEIIQKTKLPVYGATLSGNNVHDITFGGDGIFLFGNESQGISPKLLSLITNQIKIPGYGQAESLNVAIATAVVCDNFRRGIPS